MLLTASFAGESERAELPMLPSLRSNLNVSQHFEGNIEEATPLQTSTGKDVLPSTIM